jgi:hypothetical protein
MIVMARHVLGLSIDAFGSTVGLRTGT